VPDPKQPDPEQIADALKVVEDEVTKSFDRLTQVTDTVAKMRLEFFDRVVLLDGGTITLSVTLLGFWASKDAHVPMHWRELLILSWISFVFSMLFALARNWVEHDRLSATEVYNAVYQAFSAIIKFSQAVPGPLANKLVENEAARLKGKIKEEEGLLRWTKSTGIASLIAMLAGFVLLLMFAAKNVFTIGG